MDLLRQVFIINFPISAKINETFLLLFTHYDFDKSLIEVGFSTCQSLDIFATSFPELND